MKDIIKVLKDIQIKNSEKDIKFNEEMKKIEKSTDFSEAYKKKAIEKLMKEHKESKGELRAKYIIEVEKLKVFANTEKIVNLSDPKISNALKVAEILGKNIKPGEAKEIIKALSTNEDKALIGKIIKSYAPNGQVIEVIENNIIDYLSLYQAIRTEGEKALYLNSGNYFGNVLDTAERKLNGEEIATPEERPLII